MTDLPLDDDQGNTLVSCRRSGAASLTGLDPDVPLPLALVVVEHDGLVLLGRNAWRGQLEVPGGLVDPGETVHAAAVRELAEETGIEAAPDTVQLDAVVEFVLGPERRHEYAAVFTLALAGPVVPAPNEELTEFVWWDPTGEIPPGANPLDAEIARRCRPRP